MIQSTDEQQILDLMARWRSAVEQKDTVALTVDYRPDTLLFDACPPFQVRGVDGIKQVWERCLPFFPDRFRCEHQDVTVHVDGSVAFVHALHHFVPEPADHPCGQTWVRVTVGLRREADGWKVAHEHVSIPFDPMTGNAHYITDAEITENAK